MVAKLYTPCGLHSLVCVCPGWMHFKTGFLTNMTYNSMSLMKTNVEISPTGYVERCQWRTGRLQVSYKTESLLSSHVPEQREPVCLNTTVRES